MPIKLNKEVKHHLRSSVFFILAVFAKHHKRPHKRLMSTKRFIIAHGKKWSPFSSIS